MIQFSELNIRLPQIMTFPKAVCVRVSELRKRHDKSYNLKTWMSDDNNLYVGRRGRIFITDHGTLSIGKEKAIFHYKESKWANPFKVGKNHYTLVDSLILYEKYVRESTNLRNDWSELKGLTLGCFCLPNSGCHAKVLVRLYKERTTKLFKK